MKEKVVLVGGGGHCKVVIDAIMDAGEYEIEGIVDPGLRTDDQVSGFPVLGDDNVLSELYRKGIRNAFLGVGSLGDCGLRKNLYRRVKNIGFSVPVVIHPKAVIARDVKIGEGTFIAASATINPGTRIGKNAIINTSSSVDHDCEIGDFVHIAPGVTLSGGVKIGAETHIGTGANIIQNVKIGKRSFVPAGLLVKTNQPDGSRCTRD